MEEPVSSRLGSEQAIHSPRATETDPLGTKTKLCSLGSQGSDSTEASSNLWAVLAKSGLFMKHAAMCSAMLGCLSWVLLTAAR